MFGRHSVMFNWITELCSGLFSRVDMDVLIIPYIIKDKKQIYKNVLKGKCSIS